MNTYLGNEPKNIPSYSRMRLPIRRYNNSYSRYSPARALRNPPNLSWEELKQEHREYMFANLSREKPSGDFETENNF